MALKGVGPKLLKHVVFSFNFLLCVSGLALASVMGILTRESQLILADPGGSSGGNGTRGLALLAAVGGAVALAGGLGCAGAVWESEHLLLAFIGCLLLLFACQLTASRWACDYGGPLSEMRAFYDALHGVAEDPRSSRLAADVRRAFHGALKCCGKKTTTTTAGNDGQASSGGTLSCPQTPGSVATCHERLKDLVRTPDYFLYGYAAVFAVTAFEMVCGMTLCVWCAKEPMLRQRGVDPGPRHND